MDDYKELLARLDSAFYTLLDPASIKGVAWAELRASVYDSASAIRDLSAKVEAERELSADRLATWSECQRLLREERRARDTLEDDMLSVRRSFLDLLCRAEAAESRAAEWAGLCGIKDAQIADLQFRIAAIFERTRERAAKVCDKKAERFNELIQHPETTSFGHELYEAYRDQTRDLSAAIRTLAPEESAAPNETSPNP